MSILCNTSTVFPQMSSAVVLSTHSLRLLQTGSTWSSSAKRLALLFPIDFPAFESWSSTKSLATFANFSYIFCRIQCIHCGNIGFSVENMTLFDRKAFSGIISSNCEPLASSWRLRLWPLECLLWRWWLWPSWFSFRKAWGRPSIDASTKYGNQWINLKIEKYIDL